MLYPQATAWEDMFMWILWGARQCWLEVAVCNRTWLGLPVQNQQTRQLINRSKDVTGTTKQTKTGIARSHSFLLWHASQHANTRYAKASKSAAFYNDHFRLLHASACRVCVSLGSAYWSDLSAAIWDVQSSECASICDSVCSSLDDPCAVDWSGFTIVQSSCFVDWEDVIIQSLTNSL